MSHLYLAVISVTSSGAYRVYGDIAKTKPLFSGPISIATSDVAAVAATFNAAAAGSAFNAVKAVALPAVGAVCLIVDAKTEGGPVDPSAFTLTVDDNVRASDVLARESINAAYAPRLTRENVAAAIGAAVGAAVKFGF